MKECMKSVVDRRWRVRVTRLVARCALVASALNALAVAPASAQRDTTSTLYSGDFEQLMLVADHDAKVISGYYHTWRGGRECRLALHGPLKRADMGQRSSVGEGYYVDAWDPMHPELPLGAEIFSIAREGFSAQLILSMSSGGPRGCRNAASFGNGYGAALNRWNAVSSFIGVRAVRVSRMRLYDLKKVRGVLRLVRDRRYQAPLRHTGIWVQKTYSPEYAPRGFVSIAWYDGGAPRSAYVRESALYPASLPAPAEVP
jgi:hypothetical protein